MENFFARKSTGLRASFVNLNFGVRIYKFIYAPNQTKVKRGVSPDIFS